MFVFFKWTFSIKIHWVNLSGFVRHSPRGLDNKDGSMWKLPSYTLEARGIYCQVRSELARKFGFYVWWPFWLLSSAVLVERSIIILSVLCIAPFACAVRHFHFGKQSCRYPCWSVWGSQGLDFKYFPLYTAIPEVAVTLALSSQ